MIAAIAVTAALLLVYMHTVLFRADRFLVCTQESERLLAEPGETIRLSVTVANRSLWLFPYVRVTAFFADGLEPVKEGSGRRSVLSGSVSRSMMILPHRTVTYRIPVICRKRGRYPLQDILMQSGDSFGLSSRTFRMEGRGEIVVIPAKEESETFPETVGGFLGNISVRRFIHEDPVLSAGFREYTGREPLKQISWTQSAKGIGLMVRTPDYTADPSLCLILNIDSAASGKETLIEHCYVQARTLCELLEQRGFAYRMVTNAAAVGALSDTTAIQHGTGQEHYRLIMERLGRASYTCERSFAALVQYAAEQNDNTAGYLIITPSYSDRLPGHLLVRLSAQSGSEPVRFYGEDTA